MELNALNMGQGFPEFQPPQRLIEAVTNAMMDGFNQYPPMPGLLSLREVISIKEQQLHGNVVDPNHEITIVPGATAGLYSTFQALVRWGDEVIVVEPAYDSYKPAIELAGGTVVPISMVFKEQDTTNGSQTVEFPWQELKDKLNPKTRWIVLNTPHNPLGVTLKKEDWEQLEKIIEHYNVGIISDEVYEHMVFDGVKHESVLAQSGLKNRSVKISSFGKTLHCTGWKMGYVCASSEITAKIRNVFQFVAFATNSAMQKGIAHFLLEHPTWELDLNNYYRQKRDIFIDAMELATSNWKAVHCEGSYFQLLDYRGISHPEIQKLTTDLEVSFWILNNLGIATIPVGEFIQTKPQTGLLRICFAKNDDTLLQAAQGLNQVR